MPLKLQDGGQQLFLKKELQHRCFYVTFTKFLRTLFYRTPWDACFSKNIMLKVLAHEVLLNYCKYSWKWKQYKASILPLLLRIQNSTFTNIFALLDCVHFMNKNCKSWRRGAWNALREAKNHTQEDSQVQETNLASRNSYLPCSITIRRITLLIQTKTVNWTKLERIFACVKLEFVNN